MSGTKKHVCTDHGCFLSLRFKKKLMISYLEHNVYCYEISIGLPVIVREEPYQLPLLAREIKVDWEKGQLVN